MWRHLARWVLSLLLAATTEHLLLQLMLPLPTVPQIDGYGRFKTRQTEIQIRNDVRSKNRGVSSFILAKKTEVDNS